MTLGPIIYYLMLNRDRNIHTPHDANKTETEVSILDNPVYFVLPILFQ